MEGRNKYIKPYQLLYLNNVGYVTSQHSPSHIGLTRQQRAYHMDNNNGLKNEIGPTTTTTGFDTMLSFQPKSLGL